MQVREPLEEQPPPNAVSSDSHPKGAPGLATLWEGASAPDDSEGEHTDAGALLTHPQEPGAVEEPFNGGKIRGMMHPEEDLAGCLLADAANGFYNLFRLAMLWTVAHRWPQASRFAFNCYSHFSQLVIRVPGDRTPTIILSKEGVTQGDPMTMPLYGISVAVLAAQLKSEFPSLLQV